MLTNPTLRAEQARRHAWNAAALGALRYAVTVCLILAVVVTAFGALARL